MRSASYGGPQRVRRRVWPRQATPFELALTGTLSISGPRPGEIYALDWSAVYLDVEKPFFRIERT